MGKRRKGNGGGGGEGRARDEYKDVRQASKIKMTIKTRRGID